MKSFDSRTYSINDFVEWDKAKQLELNPRFQRRSVWNDKAKSFLMDSIIRGKPIPKVFIRQKLNLTTKSSIREVVDGQQRIRTILSFIKDGFTISKVHNPEYGGVAFSSLPEPVQSQILMYEVAVDLLINLPDSEILDIFNRLNSYAVVLNEQEKINAEHFGTFKVLTDRISHSYFEFWIKNGILTERQIMRMAEVSLVADLLIVMLDGAHSKKQIKRFYTIFEKEFPHSPETVKENFDSIMHTISELFPEGLKQTEFRRIHLFYTLFSAVCHRMFGVKNLSPETRLRPINIPAAREGLEHVEYIFAAEEPAQLAENERQFLTDLRRATTDEAVRIRRANYVAALMG